jgi:flagellar P-ring protein precursor FlgI
MMNRLYRHFRALSIRLTARAVLAALTVSSVVAAQIPTARVGDVTRLQGQGSNVLVGYGLVTGLAGSGDGAKFLPTMRAVAATLQRFGANIETLEDVEASKNIAIVMVEAVVPEHGAREGDTLDVKVSALAAKSLVGGRLMSTPLIYHDRSVDGLFGFARGGIVMDGATFTTGIIHGGARMERDVFMTVVSSGRALRGLGLTHPWIEPSSAYITLVLDDGHAGWSMAAAIAQALDKELGISAGVERVALALDSKSVAVLLPEHQRGDPASWIRDIEQTPILMESNEARVTINRSAGTIVVTGDTRISPVVVSQAGLTVTVAASREDGTIPQAPFSQQQFVPVDAAEQRLPNVAALLESLNRLNVPFRDRVSILEEIRRAGKLHAKLVHEG